MGKEVVEAVRAYKFFHSSINWVSIRPNEIHPNPQHKFVSSINSHSIWPFSGRAKMKASYIAMCAVLILLLADQAHVSIAVTCDPKALISPCSSATSSGVSKLCCTRIKEQVPCICKYVKQYGDFLNSPLVKKIAKTCGITFPKCWENEKAYPYPEGLLPIRTL